MVSIAILNIALLSMPVSSCSSHLGARFVTRVDGLTCEMMERVGLAHSGRLVRLVRLVYILYTLRVYRWR